MTPGLTHIWLLVEDMPRALGFYRDALGVAVLHDLGDFVELRANDHVLLSLFTREAMRVGEPALAIDPPGGQRAVLAFEVAALDEFCARLRARGIALASAAADHPEWGMRTAFVRDPDGNLLCLYGGTPA
jgi:catechol 2,3-dioxygenase-like lactoylglutathione lyase family enzyme